MPQAVFLDYASTSHHDLNLSKLEQACGQLTCWDDTQASNLLEHIGQAEIIISNKVPLTAATLTTLQKQIKLI
ncbi:MAG TPA: glycerate dehydrogenase, partial [Thiolinea sp.]|nr:glycerate dehydrogenase [Thiolinea sp.]